MNKKTLILILLSISSAHTNNAMMAKMKCRRSRSYCYERPKIEKIPTYQGTFHPDFPKEIDMNVVRFIATNTSGVTLKEAAQIFNALVCTNKFLNVYMNDNQRTLEWIKDFSKRYGPSNIDVARILCTKSANERWALQRSFLVGWNWGLRYIENDINKLKDMGLDLDFSYNNNEPTALIQTTSWREHGWNEVACWLIENGADINALTSYKQNAGMLALMGTDRGLMSVFVNHPEFKVNHQDNQKCTPLHYCFYGKVPREGSVMLDVTRCPHIYKIVKKLLGKGANPLAMNNDGKTPLMLAQESGYQPLVDLLENAAVAFKSIEK